jgi:hypothetical protein
LWPGTPGTGTVDGMLVSKSAIQNEFAKRLAEFAPPGEQLQGLFEAEYGETPFVNPTGNALFLLLTGNFVLFVGAKRMSNNPTQTLGRVPRAAIRFLPPDNGVAHFRVTAQMHDDQGQWYQIRLKIHKMWREEATAFVAAVSAPAQPQQPPPQGYPQQQPYPQQPYPQQGRQQPYPQQYPPQGQRQPVQPPYPGQPQRYPPYQQPYPPQSQQPPYPPRQGQGWS